MYVKERQWEVARGERRERVNFSRSMRGEEKGVEEDEEEEEEEEERNGEEPQGS